MSGPVARDREYVAHYGIAFKGSDDLSANFFRHYKHSQWNQLGILKLPDLFLQLDAGLELVNTSALPHNNVLSRLRFICVHQFSLSHVRSSLLALGFWLRFCRWFCLCF